MNKCKGFSRLWFLALLLVAFVAGCASNAQEIPQIPGAPGSPGAILDTTRPIVSFKYPDNAATAIPTNTKVYVGFSKIMNASTIDSNTFFVKDSSGAKIVGIIEKSGATATFAPTSALTPGATYTATVTTGAKDQALTGNALASPSVWSFTIGASPNNTLPTLTFKSPADLATNVPADTKVYIAFSKVMDPNTINSNTFFVTDSLSPAIKLVGTIEAFGTAYTFKPTSLLTPGATYTATVTTGAKDLTTPAGNALASPSSWNFTIAAAGIVPPLPNPGAAGAAPILGTVDSFGIIARDAMTLTVGVPPPHIYGDIALTGTTSTSSSLVGFALAGALPNQTSAFVTGSQALNVNSINTTDNGNSAALPQLKIDLEAVYNNNKLGSARVAPAGAPTPTGNGGTFAAGAKDLSGLVLRPGIYAVGTLSDTITIGGTGGPLVLDAQGNADAVFIFQAFTMTSTQGSVLLQNGAQPKNVFWVLTKDATVGINTYFQGTLVAGETITVNGNTNVEGRMLAGANSVAAAGTGNITVSGVISVPK